MSFHHMKKTIGLAVAAIFFLLVQSGLSSADDSNELNELKEKVNKQDAIIQQQQETIRQLAHRMEALESKLSEMKSELSIFLQNLLIRIF